MTAARDERDRRRERRGMPAGPAGPAPDSAARPVLQVLERTFAILEMFDDARPEWGTSEIARALALPVPTVHRILTALRQLGYVFQDHRTKRFHLGPAAVLLGSRARAVADLRSVAIEPLRCLSRDLGETALLTAVSADRAASTCIERVESLHPLRMSVEPGRLLPLHAGASQKALLAYMPHDEAEGIIAGRLDRLCSATLTDKRKLRADLDSIKRRGFATSLEETNAGVWGVAVPVISPTGVECAVGVAAPSARLNDDLVRRAVRRTHEAALDIAERLGCEVPSLALHSGGLATRLGGNR